MKMKKVSAALLLMGVNLAIVVLNSGSDTQSLDTSSRPDVIEIGQHGLAETEIEVTNSEEEPTLEAAPVLADNSIVGGTQPDEEYGSPTSLQMPIQESMRETEKSRRLRELRQAFHRPGIREMGGKIDAYMSRVEHVDEWAATANKQLRLWLENQPGGPQLINVECVSDVCYMDFVFTSIQMHQNFRKAVDRWWGENSSGYLGDVYSVNVGNGLNRVYFFKDTFEASGL